MTRRRIGDGQHHDGMGLKLYLWTAVGFGNRRTWKGESLEEWLADLKRTDSNRRLGEDDGDRNNLGETMLNMGLGI